GILVIGIRREQFSRRPVPDPHGPVEAPREDQLPVGREGDRINRLRVSLEEPQLGGFLRERQPLRGKAEEDAGQKQQGQTAEENSIGPQVRSHQFVLSPGTGAGSYAESADGASRYCELIGTVAEVTDRAESRRILPECGSSSRGHCSHLDPPIVAALPVGNRSANLPGSTHRAALMLRILMACAPRCPLAIAREGLSPTANPS